MDETNCERYRLGCAYNLRGLDKTRCPECGRAFDPRDARTFSTSARRRNKMPVLIAIYLGPLPLNAALWIGQPLDTVIGFVGMSGCGPLMPLLFLPVVVIWGFGGGAANRGVIEATFYALFALPWAVWFTLLWKTKLRNLHYGVHLGLAIGWWLVGTAMIVIGLSA
jgi:hypothetical protein